MTVSVIGRRNVLVVPPLVTLSSNFLTLPSSPGKVLVTKAIGQWFLSTWQSRRRTRSPSLILGRLFCHFDRSCSVQRYSRLHLSQNVLARCWTLRHCWRCRSASTKHPGGGGLQTFWVRIMFGVSRAGAFASVEMVAKGLALIMAETSAMRVDRTSWVR